MTRKFRHLVGTAALGLGALLFSTGAASAEELKQETGVPQKTDGREFETKDNHYDFGCFNGNYRADPGELRRGCNHVINPGKLVRVEPSLPPFSEIFQHEWTCTATPNDGRVSGPSASDTLSPDGFIDARVDGENVLFKIVDPDGIWRYGADYGGDGSMDKMEWAAGANVVEDSFILTPTFSGKHPVKIVYWDMGYRSKEKNLVVQAGNGEDADLASFFSWMESHGYSPEITHVYRKHLDHPLVRKQLYRDFDIREGGGNETVQSYRQGGTFTMVLHDVFPTDDGATSTSMEGDIPALEKIAERIFGRDFSFEYKPEDISYSDLIGQVLEDCVVLDGNRVRETLNAMVDDRTKGHVFHLAAETLEWGIPVCSFTGSSPAFSTEELDDGEDYVGGLYLHEWGHDIELHHHLVNQAYPFTNSFYGTDDIMVHDYIGYGNRETGRLGDPLTLYALETADGYSPETTARYNEAMENSWMLEDAYYGITNRPPTMPKVSINADNSSQCITCNAFGSFDRNGDPITYTYTWSIDGQQMPYTDNRICW
ncbi:MAG: hypothetical protein HYW25_05915 [Candidatus Aenigmarchaeota archaeon]|nr:hypothetical protein [Candidatus Aenigmarchaeota archaeon]